MVLRNTIADNEGVAPYMVFSNKNLLDIAVHRPTSMETLSRIEGITDARIKKFGKQVVDFVISFCKENKLEDNYFPASKETQEVCMKVFPLLFISKNNT